MKLNYKEFGAGEPLIILHGLMGMLDNWQGVAKQLADHFHVFILDARNHGHSPHNQVHNYDAMVEDLKEFMKDHQIKEAHLLGHSMGGKVMMAFGQRFPESVNKLIVADIGPKFYPVHHQDVLAALRAVPLDRIQKRTDAESYMMPYLDESSVRQFLMKSLYRPERGRFDWRFNLDAIESNIEEIGEAMDEHDYEGDTMFVRGGNSNYITDADWADIRMIFPHSYLITIDNAGHWLHAEKPSEFIQTVQDFLT